MVIKRNELYPHDWRQLSREIREACGWQCTQCGKQCRRPGELYLGWEYILTVAHICQDYDAPAVQLAALCLPCHLLYDAGHSWIARHRHIRLRRRVAGQLLLELG